MRDAINYPSPIRGARHAAPPICRESTKDPAAGPETSADQAALETKDLPESHAGANTRKRSRPRSPRPKQPAATWCMSPKKPPPQTDKGQSKRDTPEVPALVGEISAANEFPKPTCRAPHDEPEEWGHSPNESQAYIALDLRFTDPLIAEIVETWRLRQDMVRAQTKITLQIKSICRRFTAGDKAEADKLFASMQNGMAHPKAEACFMACLPLLEAKKPIEAARKVQEKHLAKMGARLPIAHVADDIKGVGHLALAKIVGECGDLSAYRSVSAVWKRAGLAVIDGGRQRRVAGDAALEHGYSPERRSTFWNIAAALIKAQGKDEDAGPYRRFYDAEKERQIEKGIPLGHAHNRAMRHMTKELLKAVAVEWRRVSGGAA